ncbi:hypothetical protein GCM10022284_30930 [Streptomyces hundungensis]
MELTVEFAHRARVNIEYVPPLLREQTLGQALGLLNCHGRTLAETTHLIACELNANAFYASTCTLIVRAAGGDGRRVRFARRPYLL